MKRHSAAVSGGAIMCLLIVRSMNLAQTAGAMPAEAQRAIISEYCMGCHSDAAKSGGLALSQLDLGHVEQHAEIAEKVIHKLRAGVMPPPGAKRPDIATIKAFTASLETAIDKAAAAQPNPGWRSLQRLSQTEYARSIHDLLGIDVDVAAIGTHSYQGGRPTAATTK